MTLGLSAEELIARHKAQQKAWRFEHPEKVKMYHDKHQNTDEGRTRRREWTKQNRERLNERRRELYSQRNMKVQESSGDDPQPEV